MWRFVGSVGASLSFRPLLSKVSWRSRNRRGLALEIDVVGENARKHGDLVLIEKDEPLLLSELIALLMRRFQRRRLRFYGVMPHNETGYGAGKTTSVLPNEPLLTIDGLARLLSVDRKTVYRLPIPYVIVGTRRRFRPADVDAYLEREPGP